MIHPFMSLNSMSTEHSLCVTDHKALAGVGAGTWLLLLIHREVQNTESYSQAYYIISYSSLAFILSFHSTPYMRSQYLPPPESHFPLLRLAKPGFCSLVSRFVL